MPNPTFISMAGLRTKFIFFLRILRYFLAIAGLFFLTAILLAASSLPYYSMHWLGTSRSAMKQAPSVIILMGGGGMPSESNLMRCWYVALAAAKFPDSAILISMPGAITDSLSTPCLIAGELLLRGVSNDRIRFESTGKNTRYQALECAKIIKTADPVLIISSPEHMRRAVLCFEKAGFSQVSGLPAFENAIETDMKFEDDKLGGNTVLIPDVGGSISIRYRIWNYLQFEIRVLREFTALGYYWLRGWI